MTKSNLSTMPMAQIAAGALPLSTLIGVGAAALLGVFMLYGVGVASAEMMHNAAHDTRHAISFPCH